MTDTADTEIKIEPGQMWTSVTTHDDWSTVMILEPVTAQNIASTSENQRRWAAAALRSFSDVWWVLNNSGKREYIWRSVLRTYYTLIPPVDEVDSEAEAEGSNRA
jgi:hypothetical protein